MFAYPCHRGRNESLTAISYFLEVPRLDEPEN